MNNLRLLIGIIALLTETVSLEPYYCNARTFFEAEVSVSKNSKFISDITAYSSENISVSSDPDSFKVDVTGCLTPSGLLKDAVGVEGQFIHLPTIFAGAVQFFDTLRLIKLENCNIKEIEAGAFLNLPKLETISLRFNNIQQIDVGIFNNLQIIQLDISNNNIYNIEEGAFDNMINLTILNLDKNRLKNWYHDWFQDSLNLMHISAAYNELITLPAYAFSNLKNHYTTTIQLSNNRIVFIHPYAFHGLSKLYGLWLENNNLEYLDDNVFSTFERVYILSLAGNKLKCLSENILYGIPSIDVIMRVENNSPMDCQCLQKIQDWAEQRRYYITEMYARQECERKMKIKEMNDQLILQNVSKILP